MINNLKQRYEDARQWFLRNYDNPDHKVRDQALENYKERSDEIYITGTLQTVDLERIMGEQDDPSC